MRTEIILNIAVHETRIAIMEDGNLVEILVERPENDRMVGNIYKGIVNAVLPGMQAAFIDIGTEKSAFLHASDVSEAVSNYERFFEGVDEDEEERRPPRKFVPIQQRLKNNQEILVQITKEPISTKGPRATSELSLPGRFTVLIPDDDHIGVSRKIKDWSEKRRLKRLTAEVKPEHFGVIVRTVAKDQGESEVKNDIKHLVRLWNKILKTSQNTKAPALIHREMGITSSLIRDLFNEEVDRLVVDSKRDYKQILQYVRSVSPGLESKVEFFDEKTPIFDAFQIEKEIEKAYNRRVDLKGGGSLVIDHTEALVAIDVNSGRYVGKHNQEETVFKINMEAAREIARQLRLRDLGGIIVVDFIDMAIAKNRKSVEDELYAATRRDRSKMNFSTLSEFGLLEMTRQRVRPSLLYTYSEPCPVCNGIGRVQGRDTSVTKIERWFRRARADSRERHFLLYVHPSVADYLLEEDSVRLKLLQKSAKIKIDLKKDPDLPTEEYRVFSTRIGEDITDQFKA
ncbi:MAG: Rne/Rng family ribonuclease [Candidatus Latescibacterota bacterium]